MKKIVNILLIVFTILFIGNISFASEIDTKKEDIKIHEIIEIAKIDNEKDDQGELGDLKDYVPENGTDLGKLGDKVAVVLGTIQVVGLIISVGALMAIGIKYMVSSVEEKAEYKKTFTTYLIGAFLFFTVTTLPSLIYNLVHNLGT